MTRPRARSVLRIGATLGVLQVMRDLGFDPVREIKAAGLDARVFNSPDTKISLAARGHLLDRCANSTGCPHFGLLTGSHVTLGSLGLVGLLTRHAPDVGTALRWLSRYFDLHADGVVVELRVDAGKAILTYGIHEPSIPGVRQTCDGAVVGMQNILRELCGPDFKPTEAWFAHARPDDIEPYKRLMKCHLEFETGVYAVVFSPTWLSRPLTGNEPELTRLLNEKVAEQQRLHAKSFTEQVQEVMRTALTFEQVGAARLAAMFDMHVRTFHRRLADHGTSHRELLDKTRHSLACQLLEDGRQSLPQIAELLGYAEMRSFIRAFKRWTGVTPTQWRRRTTPSNLPADARYPWPA
jgi:AraC-like DNA-binding protein